MGGADLSVSRTREQGTGRNRHGHCKGEKSEHLNFQTKGVLGFGLWPTSPLGTLAVTRMAYSPRDSAQWRNGLQ